MTSLERFRLCQLSIVLAAVLIVAGGCRPRDRNPSSAPAQANRTEEPAQTPAPAPSASRDEQMPRFAKNSPFAGDYELASEPEGKRLWAKSFLWEKSPEP